MNETKRRKLERAGWTVGTAADFLALSPEEARYVEMKLALTDAPAPGGPPSTLPKPRWPNSWGRVNHVSPRWRQVIRP